MESLSGTVTRADEGFCIYDVAISESCFEVMLIEECESAVLAECHSTHWQVTMAQCSGETVSCSAEWVGP